MAVADIIYNGESWRRITVEPAQRFIMGVDLAQSVDFTAIAIMDHHRSPRDHFQVNDETKVLRQNADEHFDLVHLERLKRGMPYPEIVQHVTMLLARDPLRPMGCDLIVDATGVGRPVFELFERAGLRPIGITITSGDGYSSLAGDWWRVSKALLVAGIDARLATGELRFAADLTEAGALRNELAEFRRHLSASGNATWSARATAHDDIVMALALCVFWATHRNKRGEFSTSFVRGLT
jgi:hypothetical protein